MAEFILHHYDTSPFSEKPRVMFGLKGLAWRSVIQPTIMPKPDLVPLTGGYRRAPVMQIGADVYCDSQVILAEILARSGDDGSAAAGGAWAVNLWADRLWFGTTVPVIFGEFGDSVPRAFIEDREKLSGRPFDVGAMKAAAGIMRSQWRAQAAWIDDALTHADFLAGAAPGLVDACAYMNIWWLGGAAPGVFEALTAGLDRLAAWRGRVPRRRPGHRPRQRSRALRRPRPRRSVRAEAGRAGHRRRRRLRPRPDRRRAGRDQPPPGGDRPPRSDPGQAECALPTGRLRSGGGIGGARLADASRTHPSPYLSPLPGRGILMGRHPFTAPPSSRSFSIPLPRQWER